MINQATLNLIASSQLCFKLLMFYGQQLGFGVGSEHRAADLAESLVP